MPLTLVTWNLQGLLGVDVAAVAAHLRDVEADVAFVQEVPRREARALARAVGAASAAWSFKHWPVRRRAEGLAVLGISVAVPTAGVAVTARWRWHDWRRRVVQRGEVTIDGMVAAVVHGHLSPHGAGATRQHELDRVLGLAPDPARLVLVGDLNEGPGGPLAARLAAARLCDAWHTAPSRSGAGETNWSGRRDRDPDQRIDYVFHGEALAATRAGVPVAGPDGWHRWAALSDHLPLTVELVAAVRPET